MLCDVSSLQTSRRLVRNSARLQLVLIGIRSFAIRLRPSNCKLMLCIYNNDLHPLVNHKTGQTTTFNKQIMKRIWQYLGNEDQPWSATCRPRSALTEPLVILRHAFLRPGKLWTFFQQLLNHVRDTHVISVVAALHTLHTEGSQRAPPPTCQAPARSRTRLEGEAGR